MHYKYLKIGLYNILNDHTIIDINDSKNTKFLIIKNDS